MLRDSIVIKREKGDYGGPMDKWIIEVNTLTPNEFIKLSKAVGWGVQREYKMPKVLEVLNDTHLKVVVRDENGQAIGCGRAFSDDLLMTFIPDIFVLPEFQKKGVGQLIVEKIKEKYGHTSFFFGAQPGNEKFFEKCGFEKSIQSYSGRFRSNPYY